MMPYLYRSFSAKEPLFLALLGSALRLLALLRKETCKPKASYASSPLCTKTHPTHTIVQISRGDRLGSSNTVPKSAQKVSFGLTDTSALNSGSNENIDPNASLAVCVCAHLSLLPSLSAAYARCVTRIAHGGGHV